MKYLEKIISSLNGGVVGCSDKQIEQLHFFVNGKKLPAAYEEFMRIMGNGAVGFITGESIYINETFNLKKSAIELLIENNSKNILTEDDFVFWMCQGCMFCFFKLSEGENPPIYYYNEAEEDNFLKIANSFTEFLINKVEKSTDTYISVDN
ncbi:MAG: SMI1/KNR4 family protein [Lachnospiraceae bacterium]|nr:SMI1/KNR4 family protein [Lachnospiraceae bacterium]